MSISAPSALIGQPPLGGMLQGWALRRRPTRPPTPNHDGGFTGMQGMASPPRRNVEGEHGIIAGSLRRLCACLSSQCRRRCIQRRETPCQMTCSLAHARKQVLQSHTTQCTPGRLNKSVTSRSLQTMSTSSANDRTSEDVLPCAFPCLRSHSLAPVQQRKPLARRPLEDKEAQNNKRRVLAHCLARPPANPMTGRECSMPRAPIWATTTTSESSPVLS
jgi:hypothetical protein